MKLTRVKSSLVMTTDCPGLLQSRIEYTIEKATGHITWLGPKIDKLEWAKVLAFFKWTNDTAHSESQVRFYINMAERRWAAWAYPQKANTGMSAQELDTDDAKKQREMFPDGAWQYFMTVHHHCGGGAFQSGTDERNEHDQDGLHITMGLMHAQQHDMHARFYLAKNCYEPDMSLFWDIGEALTAITPNSVHDVIARYQMCRHIEAEFPQQWRDNYIEVKGVNYGPTSGPFSGTVTYGRPNGEWRNGVYYPYSSAAPEAPKTAQTMGAQGEHPQKGLPLTKGEQSIGALVERIADAYNTLLESGWRTDDLFELLENDPLQVDPQLAYDVDQVCSEFEVELHHLRGEISWHRRIDIANPRSNDKEHERETRDSGNVETRGDSDPPRTARDKHWWEKGERPPMGAPSIDHGQYGHQMMD